MKAYLFLNGDPPAVMPDTSDGIVVCADGAYGYVAASVRPDAVVGDFDSLDPAAVPDGVELVRVSRFKDYTDGHIAMSYLARRGCTQAEIYGAFGGRPDHELCNYSLTAYARELGYDAVIVGDRFDVRLIEGEFSANARRGAVVSLVPFSDKIHILYTKGLKYEAVNLAVDKIHIVSVSNEALGGAFSVSVQGSALLFVER